MKSQLSHTSVLAKNSAFRVLPLRRRLRSHAASTDHLTAIVALITRVATLLRAGLPTSQVFAHASDTTGDLADTIAKNSITTTAVPAALAKLNTPEARVLAALWHICVSSGAPLADGLERIATSLERLSDLHKRRRVLLAGPRYTLILISLLPLSAIVFGELLGFAPLSVLFSPVGVVLIAVGSTLQLAGVFWTRAMVKKLADMEQASGIEYDLVAVALLSGLPVHSAKRLVVDAVDTHRAEWVRLREFTKDGAVTQVLAQADTTGQPHRSALQHASRTAERTALADLQEQAEKLGIRVLLPLSVCILPAFVVLGIVPTIISMLGVVTV